MLNDLINTGCSRESSEAVHIYIVKRYAATVSEREFFAVENPSVLLVKSGGLKMQTEETVFDLGARDLLFFSKKSFCRLIEVKEKLQFSLMVFYSERLSRENFKYQQTYPFLHPKGKELMKISLEASDYLVLSLICRLLHAEEMNRPGTDFELELQRISTNLLLFELKLIYSKYFAYGGLHISRAEKLAVQFLTVLSIHCRKHHTVKFYAGVLYVTSGYLNRVVKQVTGKPAKKMITDAVLAEAVNLLEDSVFTISEIAEELQFSSPSAFDIFFKKLMSCTPSEYRAEAAERFKSR
ncbi:helix-turn-helix domain-containing protein [Flavobacterium ginsenosidimutans]|uniref:helix-turn-helix domain-containing protein n=1 Tax=Flavobacterium ginsenosidimutans TaxID=687844 RepID=UPI0013A67BD0|nr:AraC family transcriptional regulator [Flavobacterium ginsenosidimutans]KAF2328112.1 helix-turn-helix transcriptional regulator [Flavobacterium ginsenosidimutans]